MAVIKFFNKEHHHIEIKDLKGYKDRSFNLTKNIKVKIEPVLPRSVPLILSYDSNFDKLKISYEDDYHGESFKYLGAVYRYSDEQIHSIEIGGFSESEYIKKEEITLILNFERIKDETAKEIIEDFIVELEDIKSSFREDLGKKLEKGILLLNFLKSTFPYTTKWRIEQIVSSLSKPGQGNPAVSFISAYIQALEKTPIRFERDMARLSYLERSKREIPTRRSNSREKRDQQVRELKTQLRTLKKALEIQKKTSSSIIYRDYPVIIRKIEKTENILNIYVRTGNTRDFDKIDNLLKIAEDLGGIMTSTGNAFGGIISIIANILQEIKAMWDRVKDETDVREEDVGRSQIKEIDGVHSLREKYKKTKIQMRRRDPKCDKIIELIVKNHGRVFDYRTIAKNVRCSLGYAGLVIRILRNSRLLKRTNQSPARYRINLGGLSSKEAYLRLAKSWDEKR